MSCHLLTVHEVMARLNIGRHTVYDLLRTRQLPSVQIGRCRRIPETSLDTYIETLIKEATPHGR